MPTSKRRAALAGLSFAAAVLAAPRVAGAYEHQYRLGGAVGFTSLMNGGDTGYAAQVHLDYGLTDAWNFTTKLEVADFPGEVILPSAAVGASYVIDVLQWVPYFGVMAGVADVWGPVSCTPVSKDGTGCHQPKLDLELPIGLDYLVTQRFAVGVLGRYQLTIANGPGYSFLGVFLKAEYVWGF